MNELYINAMYLPERITNRHFKNKDFISIEELVYELDDMDDELEHITEEFEDFKEYVRDNYREMSYAEQVGISDKDFIEDKYYR